MSVGVGGITVKRAFPSWPSGERFMVCGLESALAGDFKDTPHSVGDLAH